MVRGGRGAPPSRFLERGVLPPHTPRAPKIWGGVRFLPLPPRWVFEQAADVKGIVANDLAIETETRAAREQAVFRVTLPQLGRRGGGLPIGGGGDDAADEGFHVPAGFAEGHGQPVKQLGMARRLTLR